MYNLYAFLDKKSGVLSNHFVSNDPFEKVKQGLSLSLLKTSLDDPTSPYILYSDDFDLVCLSSVPDDMNGCSIKDLDSVNFSILLAASRSAYEKTQSHTSPSSDELD